MAHDVDSRRGVFVQRGGEVVEDGEEVRLDVRTALLEGDTRRHGQGDLVALALHFDARAGGLLAQALFLTVHVNTDRGARDGANGCADGSIAAVIAAGHHTGASAEDRACGSRRHDPLAGARFAGLHQR
jgi:hypothetical protein